MFHFFTWAGFEVAGVLFVARLASEGNRGMAQAMFMVPVLGSLQDLRCRAVKHYGYDLMLYERALAAVGLVLFVWQQRGHKRLSMSRYDLHPQCRQTQLIWGHLLQAVPDACPNARVSTTRRLPTTLCKFVFVQLGA